MTDQDKFLEDVTALLPALRAFGRSLCGDPSKADDLVQDTVLKAWSNREQFNLGSNLKAWLFTILRNCYYSELRHRKFEIEDPDGFIAAQIAVMPDHDAQLYLGDLSRAMQLLPVNQREALILVCATGLSYEEAADVCRVAVGTIKSRIARARDRLVNILSRDAAQVTNVPALADGMEFHRTGHRIGHRADVFR
ncbi:RNA polymerase sigma-70 factor, ECF subfamily [Steroidobacter denitrificans]|uniref:RNA polymerase sigma factor n=1 Tax=Steroidobacter denitrificans TaxID=465721 RepID=A0A127F5G7_STEDE|nr:sigma-70 family RNA polymerase sigma factor [Steroidobacter denitrificans]AMN45667.1 RNA polymerase sigma-70 factor, ECF subfamily [Steroidobacter denitrificans]